MRFCEGGGCKLLCEDVKWGQESNALPTNDVGKKITDNNATGSPNSKYKARTKR